MDDARWIPAGYKRTEVGVIPEDWEVKRLGEIASIFSGGTPSTSIASYYGGDIPWITSSDLNKSYIYEVKGKITEQGLKNSSAQMVNANTLLLALYGATSGVTAITRIQGAINQAVLAIIPQVDDSLFLFFKLSYLKKWLIDTFTQGGQPNLSGSIIKSLKIPFPPLPEQRAIAEVLSDVDALIAALERLIAKKRAIQQGAMQQLLTGQTRLPGFSEPWEVKQLGEIGALKKGRNIPKRHLSDRGKPCVLYGEIYTKYDCIAEKLSSFIPEEIASQATSIKSGDILFAGSGETAEEIGKCFAYIGDEEAYAGGDLIILTPKEGNSTFLGYHLNSSFVNKQKSDLGQGASVVHIYSSGLATLKVPFPPLPEQRAIADVLSDMDAEIAALEARRDKTRAIKQGMMQKLLTGRIRLV